MKIILVIACLLGDEKLFIGLKKFALTFKKDNSDVKSKILFYLSQIKHSEIRCSKQEFESF